jgi:hypothetical protein
LDYRNQKIVIKNKNLTDFIRQLAAGRYLIPTFQRLFIWDPEHISNLWDSVYRCYPIGTILYWKTHAALHVHRKLGGFFLPDNGYSDQAMRSYILDGQQRATSLLVSFYGGTGKVREQYTFDFTLYFDLTTAEFFFEKDHYKHKWQADAPFLVRLKDAPDLPEDYCSRLTSLRGYSEAVDRNFEQLRYVFANYSIPLICLEGFDVEGVCGIYERINQTGVRLTNMDILIARAFKNYATVVEEDFPIP